MTVFTYPYDVNYHPPMPLVDVQLESPGHTPLAKTYPALLDSGADGTLIPIDLLEIAESRCVGEARLRGITGARMIMDVYVVNIRVGPQWVRGMRVVASPMHSEIILRRNVLNHLIITLTGLASVTEISV